MKKNKEYCDFDVSDYGLVYSLCFDGFDECLSEDDLTSEDDSCSDFIVDDNSLSNDEIDLADEVVEYESIESIESIESSDSDGSDELDEDTNEY